MMKIVKTQTVKNIYCIGEILIDFVAEKQGKDLSIAHTFSKKAGGAPANVAAAIAKLGGQSYFIGCVGTDPFGRFLMKTLEDLAVSVALVQKSTVFTTLAFVSLAEDGERDFVFNRGADKHLKYNTAVSNALSEQIVHFGAATAFLGGDLHTTYKQYLEDAIAKNAFISFDPNFREDLWKNNEASFVAFCKPFIQHAHLCKFSMEEAQLISAKDELSDACNMFHEMGAKIVCITLGKEGTYISTESSKNQIGSIPVQAIDTTGAGDAFIGCLLQQIATLEYPRSIIDNIEQLFAFVQKANKAGAITTTQYGAIAALPMQTDIDLFT